MLEGLEGVLSYLKGVSTVLDDAIVIAGEGLAGELANRIHVEGLDSDINPIEAGGYSTNPYFTELKRFVNKSRIPKRRISKNKKWVQLPEGYKSFRAFSGRQTEFVDLKYTGHLQTSYRFIEDGGGVYRIGFVGQQSSDREGVTAAEKAGHLEQLYGKDIFRPADIEIENFMKDVLFEWRNRAV